MRVIQQVGKVHAAARLVEILEADLGVLDTGTVAIPKKGSGLWILVFMCCSTCCLFFYHSTLPVRGLDKMAQKK